MSLLRAVTRWIPTAGFLLVAGCGDADVEPTQDAAWDDGASFVLTSAALEDGGEFMGRHACWGDDLSPPLAWRAAPPASRAFAVVMSDLSIDLVHWVIWDIPAELSELPEGIEQVFEPELPAGSHQTESYQPATRGYLGPCPPERHSYRFALHALDVASLPGLGEASTRDEVTAAITAHSIGEARLTATGERP